MTTTHNKRKEFETMSTRGAVGFRYNGVDKIAYNHSDSYPSGLGQDLIIYLEGKTIEELKNICDEITVTNIEDDDCPFYPETGFARSFEDYQSFLKNSLFCEYAYIINLDNGTLEFYKGWNTNPKAKGRYAQFYAYDDDKRYCGVRLVKTIRLKKLFDGNVRIENDCFV